jgi:hypothetical protein
MALMALVAAVPADAAPRQTDVFCNVGTFGDCTNTFIIPQATENFDCEGTPQTDDVTCTSQQTGEVFDCEDEGTVFEVADRYLCTEIEEDEQQPGAARGGGGDGGGANPITQEGEQESEAGEIDQSFDVS